MTPEITSRMRRYVPRGEWEHVLTIADGGASIVRRGGTLEIHVQVGRVGRRHGYGHTLEHIAVTRAHASDAAEHVGYRLGGYLGIYPCRDSRPYRVWTLTHA